MPRTPVRATPLPPSPGPARGRGPAAGKRRKGRGTPRPGGAARGGPPPLLSSHVGPRPLRGGRRSPPAPDRGPGPRTRRRPPAERRSPRGGKRERERERPRPGRSDKPLCRGLTFNRSQRGSCSATYETPTQKQVVYEWFSTRCPTNVRCVTGEGAAAFPAAPRVPGRRALRTGPRSRRAAGARRAAAPAGGERGRRPAGGDGGGPAIRGRPRLPRRCRIVPPGRDSDLEAFSHNPTDGSFAPLAPQPSTYTKCLNLRFLSY